MCRGGFLKARNLRDVVREEERDEARFEFEKPLCRYRMEMETSGRTVTVR